MNVMSELKSFDWDGVRRCYIPGPELDIRGDLRLHRTTDETVDPITYEVLRNSLVGANFEHGALLQQLCVSPVVIFARDFQTALLTETGDMVCMGPNLQYFANSSSLVARWIMENRSENPGVRPGDVWFCNDPYVGCPHQPDACIAVPIFTDGALFGWVTNIIHYLDVGGPVSGLNFDARNVWDESPLFPPMQIAEGGRIREDLVDLFVRQSRLPLMIATDIKAAIASCQTAQRKIEGMIGRYGANTVKAVMNGMLDTGSKLFTERLASIPDGRWSHRIYTEGSCGGDEKIYRVVLNVTKHGDRITIDNDGTDAQAGSINLTFGPFSGAVFTALTMQFTPELSGAVGGVYRHVDFDLTPGLLTSPEHPAAITPTGGISAMLSIYCALLATGKMISCSSDPELRARAIGPSIPHFYGCSLDVTGDGGYWNVLGADGMIGSLGGMATRDGMEAGGHIWIPEAIAPNIEHYELQGPVLYLYRRFLAGNGEGAGRMRGGRGIELGVMLRGENLEGHCPHNPNEGFAKSQGQWGGSPGSRATFRVKLGADARTRMAAGSIPQSFDELAGQSPPMGYRSLVKPRLASGDVFTWTSPTTAGWGDPLLRAPEAVLHDVESGNCTAEAAVEVYGVVIRDGAIDAAATAGRRAAIREERLERPPMREPGGGRFAADAAHVGDSLVVSEGHWYCMCGEPLGTEGANYKLGTILREKAIQDIGETYRPDAPQSADQMVFRAFHCPGCGTRIDTELALRSDPVLHDVELEEGA